jgi:hypothetical protein
MKKNLVLLFILFSVASLAIGAVTNISVLNECGSNGETLHPSATYTIRGIVTTINLDGLSLQFYLQDATGGIQVYSNGQAALYSSKGLAIGADVTITGQCSQYYGAIELLGSLDADIVKNGMGTVPDPQTITIAELQDLTVADQARFNLRGKLVKLNNVFKANPVPSGGTAWPALGNDSNKFCVAVGSESATPTGILRFDKDTDCDEHSEPTWPQNVRGFMTQNDGTSPYFSTFQITPSAYSDFTSTSSVGDWELY